MIKNFKCKDSEKVSNGYYSKKFPNDMQKRALRKIRQIDAASCLDDLKNPPSNHLEKLQGDRKHQMSIRINQKWRLCFQWDNNEAHDVEIVDYH